MRKTFASIDIAKLFASILIFSMHCNALGDYKYGGISLEILARWGVPFFFICSSYFLFQKSVDGNIDRSAIHRYLNRIGSLYLVWLIFNLPNVIYKRLYFKDISAISTWTVFLKESLLSSTFTGSWYLASSMFSAWLVYLLSKRFRTRSVLQLTFIFYPLSVLTSAYYGLLSPASVLSKVLNFLCFPLNIFNGCFYFALGKYIYENESKLITYFTRKKAMLLFIVFYILFVVEIIITKRLNIFGATDVAFSTAFFSFFLFLFCLQTTCDIQNGPFLRKLSTIIYCCQGNVLLVNGFIKKYVGLPSVFSFLISALIVVMISIIVIRIQKANRWKWVRYLT